MKNTLPVYSIRDFKTFSKPNSFYVNRLKPHVHAHGFTNAPHKHDFYFVVLFTKGSGTHEVDFKTYTVKKGALFLLKPGQMHSWKLSEDCDGFVFFHTRDFYDEAYTLGNLKNYPFYASFQSPPLLQLKEPLLAKISDVLTEMQKEYKGNEVLKFQKIHSLLNLVYIELTRSYDTKIKMDKETYLVKLRAFEDLIDSHFREIKYAGEYAKLMHLSEKHLNRICNICFNKTSSDLIAERIILEARRMLIQSKLTISEISLQLGYNDNSYFNRFFKKRTGQTPLEFRKAQST